MVVRRSFCSGGGDGVDGEDANLGVSCFTGCAFGSTRGEPAEYVTTAEAPTRARPPT